MKKNKYKIAIDVLSQELNRLGGIVFARFLSDQDSEVKKSVEAMEFMTRLMNGELTNTDDYLLPYLEPMWEINSAIKKLREIK